MPLIERAFAGEGGSYSAGFYRSRRNYPRPDKKQRTAKMDKAVMYPLKNADGNIQEVMLIHEDITELKRSKMKSQRLTAQIENQRKYLQELVCECSRRCLGSLGRTGCKKSAEIDFVSYYVEEMLGYTVEEWLSTPNFWLTIVHGDDR